MQVYRKRIGFLVSYQTLIPHGGIGQFAKSFCDLMYEHNIKVDIITDKEPEHTDFIKSIKANIIYPDDSLPYSDHSLIFMYDDTFCYERMVNFRNSIIKALNKNIYDVFVCNTYESVQVASTMGLEDVIQIIAYTHLESQIFKDTKNPFLYNTNELMRQQLSTNGVTVGTQSTFNRIQFEHAYHLPIPLTEKELLKEHNKHREGVLFIGRWEEGKNPETFLELIKQTQLPARVMTNNKGAIKFEDQLKKLKVDYQIKIGLTGQEKVDFITSCRLAFNPSTVESYGMAFYEQIIQLPTLVLDNQRWTQNFVGCKFFVVSKRNMVESALSLYDEFVNASDYYKFSPLKRYQQQEESVFHKWNDCFNEFTPHFSNSSKAQICNSTTVSVKEYIKSLERKIICIDDVRSILTNKNKFRVIYTDNDTYLTKDPSFEPIEENTGTSLFEGI